MSEERQRPTMHHPKAQVHSPKHGQMPLYQPSVHPCQKPITKPWYYECKPPTMIVNQVIGQGEAQEALTIHLCIPRPKPSAQQIIDVFVKKLRITHVTVKTDCVIVCGDFELKAIYVACRPTQPVHAVEAHRVRFTTHIPIWGARCGMEADAAVMVEYVDYDCDYHTRKGHQIFSDKKSQHIEWNQNAYHHEKECMSWEEESECLCAPHHLHCVRRFEAAVVLRITAKVLVGREIAVSYSSSVPIPPKG